jgi:hypothetical protein
LPAGPGFRREEIKLQAAHERANAYQRIRCTGNHCGWRAGTLPH